MSKVLCLGDACADIVIPYGSAKNNIEAEVAFSSGGTVANTASGLGKLNCNCSFVGTAGNDYYGKILKKDLENEGVDCTHFNLKDDLSTVSILVVIDENKDRFPFLMPKKNPSHLQIFDEDLTDDLLEGVDLVHTSGLMLFEKPACESVVNFLKKCQSKNIKTSLDINMRIETKSMDTTYIKEAIKYTNYLFASAYDELVPLTGIDDYKEAAKSLVSDERVVVARLGEKGADIFTKNEIIHNDSYEVKVVDTLGAGDAYNAGFIYGIINKKDLETCNKYGCATAAINITKQGARNCPSEKELLDFLCVVC